MASPKATNYDMQFEIHFIGSDSESGRAQLLLKIAKMMNPDASDLSVYSAIGIDRKIRYIELDGKTIKLLFLNTHGGEKFHCVIGNYLKKAMGIVGVYDITEEYSIGYLSRLMDAVQKHANENVVKMIIGNNCHKEDERKTSTKQGEELAASCGAKFMEVSVSKGTNVEEAFNTLVKDIKQKVDDGALEKVSQPTKTETKSSSKSATSSCGLF